MYQQQIGIEDSGDLVAWIGGEFRILCVRRNNGRHEAMTGTLMVKPGLVSFDYCFQGRRDSENCMIEALATGLNGHAKIFVVTVLRSEKEETWRLYTDQPGNGSTTTKEKIQQLAAEAIR